MLSTWREGLAALAKLPHVNIKLSMAQFILEVWCGFMSRVRLHVALPRTLYTHAQDVFTNPASEAVVRGMFREAIELFGPARCMFASNFPVDKLSGTKMADMYAAYKSWVADLPEDTQRQLLHDTAVRVYKL